MLRIAEAAFEWCVASLSDSGTDGGSLSDEELSSNARRLAVILISATNFPGKELPVPAAWEEMGRLAKKLKSEQPDPIETVFPCFRDESLDTSLVDAPTLSELGFFYERLKDFQAIRKNGKVKIQSSHLKRKRSGTYFTPLKVCEFMVRRVLEPVFEKAEANPSHLFDARLIDPAMGTGQFLLAACELIVGCMKTATAQETLSLRRRVYNDCLFGVELDEENLEVARFLIGLYTQEKEPALPGIMQGDSLIDSDKDSGVFGDEGFPEKIFSARGADFDGFDAIVGNPPYLSAKSSIFAKYKPYLAGSTQADFYLLFIRKYAARKYLRTGGGLCFIVPDPLLLRANAEGARQRLLDSLELEMLLHIRGVFPKTSVANVIFLARRQLEKKSETVQVARIEKRSRVQSFRKNAERLVGKMSRQIPREYFHRAKRKEFRYLLTEHAAKVMKCLDTTRPARQGAGIIIRSLQTLASTKGAIFRGEEIGKTRVKEWASTESGNGLPVLLGGESIARYKVNGNGIYMPVDKIKKDHDRYQRQKILLQKSTGRIVAAYDSHGYVVPQSVYGILIDDHRIGYPFLLTQLNSRLLNYFMQIMFTGYKLLQPQIEIEDIKQLPVIIPVFEETKETRNRSLDTAKSLFAQYVRTDDPGWILEYVDDSMKLGSNYGSAMIHDLLDFLGQEMIAACEGESEDALPRERLEWIIDLVIYRVFGLGLDEIETVENFFTDNNEALYLEAKEPAGLPERFSQPEEAPAPVENPYAADLAPEESGDKATGDGEGETSAPDATDDPEGESTLEAGGA